MNQQALAIIQDEQLDRESVAEAKQESFQHLCMDQVGSYLDNGWSHIGHQMKPRDCVSEALSESFNDTDRASGGMDLLMLQAIKANRSGDLNLQKHLLNEYALQSMQGALNYLIEMGANDVNERLGTEQVAEPIIIETAH